MSTSPVTDAAWEAPSRIPHATYIILAILVMMADLMLWSVSPGLSLIVFAAALAGGLQLVMRDRAKHQAIAWQILGLSLIPAFDLVQFLSVLSATLGLAAFATVLSGATPHTILRAILRLPFTSMGQAMTDAETLAKTRPTVRTQSLAQWSNDWIVPLSLGFVFLILILIANPVAQEIMGELFSIRLLRNFDLGRPLFWITAAAMLWPAVRLPAYTQRLFAPIKATAKTPRGKLINPRSVTRALIMFNVLFAVQTLMDAAILTTGAGLPAGMTYAKYAHQGAYPLLATALLAGGFAILAQPVIGDNKTIRALLLAWVAQTVLLMISSMLRLDFYIGAYGLTHWRFAAFVWMGLVAAGLSLMVWQIAKRLPVWWMIIRSAGLGLAALYVCAFINIAGLIATKNLDRDTGRIDTYYICSLGEGAVPAIRAHEIATGSPFCHSRHPTVTSPADWREWGYRNYRLRSSVARMQGSTS